MFKTLTFLLGSTAASVNESFKSYLKGDEPVNHEVFEKMWGSYSAEFKSLNTDKSLAERKSNFAKNIEEIIEHNSKSAKSFTKGINKFSDMTHEEFMAYYMMREGPSESQHCSATSERSEVEKNVNLEDIPATWDWRQHGGVSPVKN